MVELYRNASDLEHWYVRIPGTGWVRFPVKTGGWAERRIVPTLSHRSLSRLPLWLAFNTGLLEAIERRQPERAA
jgi:hypothetical protein